MNIIVPIINTSFDTQGLNMANVYCSIQGEQKLIDHVGVLPAIQKVFNARGGDALSCDEVLPEASASLSELFGENMARALLNIRQEIHAVFLLNSQGGYIAIEEELRELVDGIRSRGGKVMSFVSNVSSAAARFLGAMDYIYAFETSQILFHDIGLRNDDGSVQSMDAFFNNHLKQMGFSMQVSVSHGDGIPERFIREKVVDSKKVQALKKLQDARQDPNNEDNLVIYSGLELEGMITETAQTYSELGALFTRKTGIELNFRDLVRDKIARLFYVWDRWNSFTEGIRRKTGDDNIGFQQELEIQEPSFTSSITAEHQEMTCRLLREAINGDDR